MLTHHRPVQWGWRGSLHCRTACLWLLCGWVTLPLSHHGGPWLRSKRSRAGFPGPSCRRSHSPQLPAQQKRIQNWYFNFISSGKPNTFQWSSPLWTRLNVNAHLWHRQAHPEQLFCHFQQSSRKYQNKVCSVANLLLLHVWCHHQHLCCWVLHLQTTTTTTTIVLITRLGFAHFPTDVTIGVKSWR